MATINPYGKDIITVTTEFEGRPLTLEVNRVGFRTTASVLVTYGETVVLGTAMVGSRPVVLDYFPLSIDYEEKMYAAGKISGSRFISVKAAQVKRQSLLVVLSTAQSAHYSLRATAKKFRLLPVSFRWTRLSVLTW